MNQELEKVGLKKKKRKQNKKDQKMSEIRVNLKEKRLLKKPLTKFKHIVIRQF